MRILVANRGEIACRIIKTIKTMGHEAVAVYSTEDKNLEHVKIADYSVCIGPGDPKESYLNMLNILIVATSLEIDGIHPGYGFLSENSKFVDLCEEVGVKFIGPSAKNIEVMGDKINALNIMKEANEGLIDSQFEEIKDKEDLNLIIKKLGYPFIIKYALGGGGKGMRIVKEESEVQNSYDMVVSEAKQLDDNPRIFAEKFIEDAKHIEIQVIADQFGNVCHLGSRDCSLQRNSQKIIEEAPAHINEALLNKMIKVSLNIVKEIKYEGVGTIEFLVKGDKFYFLEMNTRLQVEHTVTEQIFNIDLVKEQINIAFGNPLSFAQEDINLKGHSIECRINAEDALNNFMPIPGVIEKLSLYEKKQIRNDFGFVEGNKISPFYDSLIGKIIVTGKNREEAINNMIEAIDNMHIKGIKTIANFSRALLTNKDFINNVHTTTYIKDNYENLIKEVETTQINK